MSTKSPYGSRSKIVSRQTASTCQLPAALRISSLRAIRSLGNIAVRRHKLSLKPVSTHFSASHLPLQSALHDRLYERCHTYFLHNMPNLASKLPLSGHVYSKLLGPVASLAIIAVSAQASLAINQWQQFVRYILPRVRCCFARSNA